MANGKYSRKFMVGDITPMELYNLAKDDGDYDAMFELGRWIWQNKIRFLDLRDKDSGIELVKQSCVNGCDAADEYLADLYGSRYFEQLFLGANGSYGKNVL